jgi:thiol:disulfide interchange protein DsbD
VIFAFVLTMLEVWEVRMPSFLGTGKSVELMNREGGIGAFFKGIITTLLAIPCTAPFLAAALTWVEQEMISGNYGRVLLAYLTIGFGMASPYLVIGAFPELIRFLPKPGAWMDTFKKIMGFVLLTVVVWILYFMRLPMVVPTVAVLFAIWFACWYIGKQSLTAKTGEHVKAWVISLLVVAFVFCFSFSNASPFPNLTLQNAMQRKIDRENERYAMQREEKWIRIFNKSTGQTDTAAVSEQSNHWKPFSIARLGACLDEGKPVIVDFTADWCATCKVLEATVLNSDAVIAKFEAKNAVTLQADWTDGDEEITQTLKQLGGEQIPVVAIFDPREPNKPIVLRGIFRAVTLLEQLDKLP